MYRSRKGRERSRQGTDPAEMLNTDIMRFFAIMALCLMAIFALVQSTSQKSEVSGPDLIDNTSLQQRVDVLEAKKNQLEQELKQLKKLVTLEKQEQNKQKSLQEFARQEIKYAGENLGFAKEALKKKQLQQARKKTALAKSSLDAAEKVIAKASKKQIGAKTVSKKPPRKKGFQLRFADYSALYTLLRAGSVQLYMVVDGQSWAYRYSGKQATFIKQKPMGQFYQMTTESVPSTIVSAGRHVVSHHGEGGVLYGVLLPESLKKQINSCMQKGEGGSLTIQRDGQLQCSSG